MNPRTLRAVIDAIWKGAPEVKKAEEGFFGLRRSSSTLGKSLKTLGAVGAMAISGLALAIAGAVASMGPAVIGLASSVEEAESKFQTVFSTTADSVNDRVDDLADAIGRSRHAIAGMTADTADILKPLGFAEGAAGDLSLTLSQLAIDLSSFNDMPVDEAMQRLQGTLIGSHENALAFGVVINENTLKSELAAMGADKYTGAMLEQAKVQARINLLLKGTTDAQGDAARTADSFSNQFRSLKDQISDVGVEIGTALLPAASELVKSLSVIATEYGPPVIAFFEGIAPHAQSAAVAIRALAGTGEEVEALKESIGGVANSVMSAQEKISLLNQARNDLGLIGMLTGTSSEIKKETSDIASSVLDGSEDIETATQKLADAFNIDTSHYLSNPARDLMAVGIDVERAVENARERLNTLSAAGSSEGFGPNVIGGTPEHVREYSYAIDDVASSLQGLDVSNLQGDVTKTIDQQIAVIEARQAAMVSSFRTSEGLFGNLATAYADLEAAQGDWVNHYYDNSAEISSLQQQLAYDLTDEERKHWQGVLGEAAEGSAAYVDAYNKLQNDLSDSQRQSVVVELAGTDFKSGMYEVYTGDIEAAEAAEAAILAANSAISDSYNQTVVDALLAQQGVTQGTLDLMVAMGLISEQEAEVRLQYVQTTDALQRLTESSAFYALATEDQAEAIGLLRGGYVTTIEQAMSFAEVIDGEVSDSLQKGIDLTKEQVGLLDELSREHQVNVTILTNGLEQLQNAHQLVRELGAAEAESIASRQHGATIGDAASSGIQSGGSSGTSSQVVYNDQKTVNVYTNEADVVNDLVESASSEAGFR